MFAENNSEPKNETQTMRACRKIKFCLVLGVAMAFEEVQVFAS